MDGRKTIEIRNDKIVLINLKMLCYHKDIEEGRVRKWKNVDFKKLDN